MHLSTSSSEAVDVRRFALHAASFLGLQVIIALMISWPFVRQAPETYMAALNDKQHRLETVTDPRLILAGSSNLALSFDSSHVKTRLGLEAVNLGIHQGLGLNWVLNNTARHAKKGDVILVSLEYAHYRADLTTDIVAESLIAAPAATLAGADGRILQRIPDQVLALLGRRTRTLGLAGLGRSALQPEHPYRRDSFNRWGDAIAHLDLPPLANREKGIPIPVQSPRIDQVIDTLNAFAQSSREQGATLLYSHPPYPAFEYTRDKSALDHLHAALLRRLSFPVISTPAETVYPDDDFFDTEYHTLRQSRSLRTELVLNRLAERLHSPQPGE